ncbi:hypothetical protein LTS12_027176 [Elasticomyces elasticus]|nr:hypothetical protein LTS12_027176 [Elasticomyces elasticus]
MTPLLDFPAELLEMVADECCPEDLLLLRLTCSVLYTTSQRAVCREFFATKSFILACPQSMKALVAIAKHKHFGSSMKSIRLLAQMVPHAGLDYHRRVFERGSRSAQRDRNQREQHREERRKHSQLHDTQTAFWQQHGWSPCITEALRHLGTAPGSSKIALYIGPADSATEGASGRQRLQGALGYLRCLENVEFAAEQSVEIMRAVTAAACSVVDLTCGDSMWASHPSIPLSNSPNVPLLFGPEVYRQLHSAKILLSTNTGVEPEAVQRLSSFLAGKQSLTHLALSAKGSYDGVDVFAMLAAIVHLPVITTLTLDEMTVHLVDLETFCKRHRRTLRTVIVHDSIYNDVELEALQHLKEQLAQESPRITLELNKE